MIIDDDDLIADPTKASRPICRRRDAVDAEALR
jgi:hypothetical protein